VFSSRFITDIVSYPELREGTITLMDIAQGPLDLATAFAKRLVEQNKFNTKIESTTDRRKALAGADYVLITLKVGGVHHLDIERSIALKYGVDQGDMACIGSGERLIPSGTCRRFCRFVMIWKNFAPTRCY